MKILFIHQNCPGQYKHLVRVLAENPNNQVVFITKPNKPPLPGVRKVEYLPKRETSHNIHPYIVRLEDGVLHGQGVARVAIELKSEGFIPDIIYAHVGWGEALYVKDIWPKTPLLGYFEFYYHAFGADVYFDPQEPHNIDTICRIRTKNALQLLNLEAADWGISPTRWQWQQFPEPFRNKISVIHDGIDTTTIVPNPTATLSLSDGLTLKAGDEVVTYVARNLEPYRGFPSFMRAAELILQRRPQCHILVIGGDDVSYGAHLKDGTYREQILQEVNLDQSRIHFLGRVPYNRLLQILQVSAAHIYLTVPFVLSWSMLEAMAAECLIIGSDTPPVAEVIKDRQNGLLVDFFSPQLIADRVDEVLDHPDRMHQIRQQARHTILERYALDICLPKHLQLITTLVKGQKPNPIGTARQQGQQVLTLRHPNRHSRVIPAKLKRR